MVVAATAATPPPPIGVSRERARTGIWGGRVAGVAEAASTDSPTHLLGG